MGGGGSRGQTLAAGENGPDCRSGLGTVPLHKFCVPGLYRVHNCRIPIVQLFSQKETSFLIPLLKVILRLYGMLYDVSFQASKNYKWEINNMQSHKDITKSPKMLPVFQLVT